MATELNPSAATSNGYEWLAPVRYQLLSPTCDANTVAYWSFDEASGDLLDSCGTKHMTRAAGLSQVSGIYGEGQDGSAGGYAYTSGSVLQNFQGGITMDLWVKNLPVTNTQNYILSNGGETSMCGSRGMTIASVKSGANKMLRITGPGSTCTLYDNSSSIIFDQPEWKHLVVTWTGDTSAGGMKIYVDGVLRTTCTNTAMGTTNQTCRWTVGRSAANTYPGYGQYDSVRVSNIVRDASWVEQEYADGIANNAPAPIVGSVSPNSKAVGAATFTITVNGSNFQSNSEVRLNGSSRTTTFITDTQLTATVPSTDLTTAGLKAITVYNPGNGATSGAVNLTVNNPAPTLTLISPSVKSAGDATFTLSVEGTNFNTQSVIKFNGSNLTTTFVDANHLTASVSNTLIAAAASNSITVFNPTPGGGTSSAMTLTVNNPAPTITSISPTTGSLGGSNTTLTVNGTGFTTQSVVVMSGTPLTTTYVNSTQVTATVTSSELSLAVEHVVIVFNPTPGGGSSNVKTYTVSNASPTLSSISPSSKLVGQSGFTMTLTGTGFNTSSVVNYAGVARTTTFISNTSLQITVDDTELLSTGTKAITVTNPAPGGGTSGSQNFTINNPVPTLASISPTTKIAGDADFSLTVTGTNFVPGSTVRIAGNNRTTTYIDSNTLFAEILASDIASAGPKAITVNTPTPGGGTTSSVTLTVSSATVNSLSMGIVDVDKIVNGTTNDATTFSIGSANNDWYGIEVAGIGDIDNDGVPDMAGAAILQGSGSVYIHRMNADGTLKGTTKLTSGTNNMPVIANGSQLGNGIVGLGDINADGVEDIAVGSTNSATPVVYLLRLQTTGAVIASGGSSTLTGVAGSGFGSCVANLGDIDNNGYDDIGVGGFFANGNSGQFVVHRMGANGALVAANEIKHGTTQSAGGTLSLSSASGGNFGSGCQGIGDMDGDGVEDVAVGAYHQSTGGGRGAVFILYLNSDGTLKTSARIDSTSGNGGATYGTAVSSFGDVDGDGIHDIFVGDDTVSRVYLHLLNSNGTVKQTPLTFQSGSPTGNPTFSGNGYGIGVGAIGDIDGNGVQDLGIGAFVDATGGAGRGAVYVTRLSLNNPSPTLSSISPNTKTAGDAGFTLTATGTNFVTGSVIRFAGSDRATTFVNSTSLTASILSGDILTAGVYAITVFNPGPGGGTSSAASLTVNNPVPTLTSISPNTKNVGDSSFVLTATGTNFNSQTVIRVGGVGRTTTVNSATSASVTISANEMLTAGTLSVTVHNPTPGGGTTSAQTLTINNPSPVATSVSPSSIQAGATGQIVSIFGSNFNTQSVVYVNNVSRTTTYNNGHLDVTFSTLELASPTTYAIKVVNPAPGGGTSSPDLTLTVAYPSPVASSLSPSTVSAGASTFTLTVNGSGIGSYSTVYFDNVAQSTTWTGSALTISVNAGSVTSAGTHAVKIVNPAPGGGTSAPDLVLSVTNPVPVISSISPNSKTAGDADFVLAVNGTSIGSYSTISFNGVAKSTTYVSGHLEATITSADLAAAGTYNVSIVNATPGGGTSDTETLTVNNPAPTLTGISPSSKLAGSAQFTMTLTGSSFSGDSVVRVDGAPRATTFVNSTTLTATIPAADVASGGARTITVFTPGPGGGTSGSQTLTVSAPLSITVNPQAPFNFERVNISAGVGDYPEGIVSIDIYLDGTDPGDLVKSCQYGGGPNSATCEFVSSALPRGIHTLYATLTDDAAGQADASLDFTVQSVTTFNRIHLSRLKTGEISEVTLSYTLDGTTQEPLIVTFPEAFTVLQQFISLPECASDASFSEQLLIVDVSGCSGSLEFGGALVQNPSTPGTYKITWTDDEGEGSVIILEADQITVLASVDPYMTFDVGADNDACDGTWTSSDYAVNLGVLNSSGVTTSGVGGIEHICTKLSTNATSGAVVTVQSLNASLQSASVPGDAIPTSTGTLAGGTAGYGLCVSTVGGEIGRDTTVPIGAVPTAQGDYAGTCSTTDHDVGALSTGPLQIWTLDDPSWNSFAKIYVKAAISGTTPAHTDYRDILTFIATSTY